MSDALQVDERELEQAMARHTLMFAKPENPYYIRAPDYRETSSGIVSLHYLCHILNLSGREAYLCGAQELNPNLKTPVLDAATEKRHRDAGKVPIAVYPEVVTGNPMGCRVVSRFLLNFEGLISGKSMEAAATDLIFYYGTKLAEKRGQANPDLLGLPVIDISLFNLPAGDAPRTGRYLYQNRHPLEEIDHSLFPADTQMLRIASALSLEELAQVLRSAQVMYSYEWSMTCVIAVLCGCPVIFVPGHGVDQPFLESSFIGSAGFAMLDQPDALAIAKAGAEGALKRYVAGTLPFWSQLDVFIAKTQAAARQVAIEDRLGGISWLRNRYPDAQQLRLMRARLDSPQAPLIGVLVLDGGSQPHLLARTLTSLEPQRCLYPHVHIRVLAASDASTVSVDARVESVTCEVSQRPEMINTLLRDSRCDWFIIVEAGAEFTASGLLVAALDLMATPQTCLAAYGDEAMRMGDGVVDLALRPDLNLDLLLSFPASTSSHWLFHRQSCVQLGGFDAGSGEAFELEYQLRLIEQQGLASVGHIAEPLLIGEAPRLRDCAQVRAVIERHLQARGYPQGQALPIPALPGRYRIDYGHAQAAAVSILVVLEGRLGQFQRCVESLLENTELPGGFEIVLIAQGNSDEATGQWLDAVEQIGGEQICVLRYDAGHSRAAVCNHAAQQARGDLLLWLGAGAGILGRGWLQPLLNHALRPEVGAVGAKLLTAEGKIQHAGLVLGLGGSVGRAFQGVSHQDGGYMGRLQVDQGYSALSDECLMLRRELFLEAGGFVEDPLLARWADVDLCLRLREAGYLNVWTPHAQLLMDPRDTGPVTLEDQDALYARWLAQLALDPAYNANLSLQAGGGFATASNALAWRPLQSWRPLPLVLAYPAPQTVAGQLRVQQPLRALCDAGRVEAMTVPSLLTLVELERLKPDSIVLQRPLDDAQLQNMRQMRAFSRAFKVYDLDGYLPDMRLQSADGQYTSEDILQRLQHGLMHVDRVIVATPTLAEVVAGQHDDIRVLENCLPSVWWSQVNGRRQMGRKPRVGWSGAVDAHLLVEVVKALAGEVEWVVQGDCPDALRPYVSEHYGNVPLDQRAAALAGMNLDLALAPMASSLLTACSGNSILLEYAACGYPVVCSKVPGFAGIDVLPLTRVENSVAHWLEAIRMHLGDPQASGSLGEVLQGTVRRDWMLEGVRLEQWRNAWLAD